MCHPIRYSFGELTWVTWLTSKSFHWDRTWHPYISLIQLQPKLQTIFLFYEQKLLIVQKSSILHMSLPDGIFIFKSRKTEIHTLLKKISTQYFVHKANWFKFSRPKQKKTLQIFQIIENVRPHTQCWNCFCSFTRNFSASLCGSDKVQDPESKDQKFNFLCCQCVVISLCF